MLFSMVQAVEGLRRYLARTAPFYGAREGKKSGLTTLDALLGDGLPKGALTVITGPTGAGRLTLAARIAAEETKQRRPIAWIDGKGTLYPPALAAEGVRLDRVLMVKSRDERVAYAAEQIAGSGAFGVVVASGLDALLTPTRTRRLQTATEGQRIITLLILDPKTAARLTGTALELHLSRKNRSIMIEVQKDRTGFATGRRALLSLAQ